MNGLSLVPFALSAVLCMTGVRLGRWLPPRVAAVGLTALAVVVATAALVALALAGMLAVAQLPWVARTGHWSAPTLGSVSNLPLALCWVGGLLGAALAMRTAVHAVAVGRALGRAAAAVRMMSPGRRGRRIGADRCRPGQPLAAAIDPIGPGEVGPGEVSPGEISPAEMSIVDDAIPDAYAVAGLRGHVVVTTSMLRLLPAAERRALLAHEAAHVRHRHHLYVQAVRLAACVNPMLRPSVAAVTLAVERWADEDAAAAVRDRRVVARSLARAALGRRAATAAPTVLAAADHQVGDRVRFLLAPRPRRRPLTAGAVAAVIVACSAASVASAGVAHDRIEVAETVYAHVVSP